MSVKPPPPAEFTPIQPGASLIIAWQIKGQRVVLIGGGAVAAGRLSAVLDASAVVTLISPRSGLSPEVANRLNDPATKELITYHDRTYAGKEDLEGADMVFTAIDQAGLSSEIAVACRARRIPVNVADVPPECDFYFGSIVRRGPLQIMVSTGGKGPRIANRVRRQIEDGLPAQVGQAIERVGQLRMGLRRRAPQKDVETIAKRMKWMVRVCDKWSLAELAAMDDRMLEDVLQGWETGTAKGYYDVRGGAWAGLMSAVGLGKVHCPAKSTPDGKPSRCPFLVGSTGFVAGLATAAVVAAVVARVRR